jgi:hypothetical protein
MAGSHAVLTAAGIGAASWQATVARPEIIERLSKFE